ncbi:hypothetical protein [Xanthobacter aminoxidans]|uniref:Uncharacterized protein n=1 Tax=Xanthobacter aminoxidans TaxID=186280 RepID=A0ABW6ZNL4_9HYPH
MLTAMLLEMRLVSGLSQAQIDEETGLFANGRRLRNRPGQAGRAKPYTRNLICQAYKRLVPSPLSPHLREAHEELVELKRKPGSEALRRFLEINDGVLDDVLRENHPEDGLRRLEYFYFRLLVSFSMAIHGNRQATWCGGRFSHHLIVAQTAAEKGIVLADRLLQSEVHDGEATGRVKRLRALLVINLFQIYLEQYKRGYPNAAGQVVTCDQLKAQFLEQDALGKHWALVEEFPYLWQAIYNGLEQASFLEVEEPALRFYRKLVELDPGFQDFDYTPGEVDALSKEKQMAWFCERFRSTLHTPNP